MHEPHPRLCRRCGFAATGALSASHKELDIIGFLFLAAVTGIGGGTLRVLILNVPVFWVVKPSVLLVCAAVAVAVFFGASLLELSYKLLLWLDALGLAAYGVFGAYKGLAVTGLATVVLGMGMLTGAAGGILRDVLSREPSVLMRGKICVAAALVGAATVLLLDALGLPSQLATKVGIVSVFAARSGPWPSAGASGPTARGPDATRRTFREREIR